MDLATATLLSRKSANKLQMPAVWIGLVGVVRMAAAAVAAIDSIPDLLPAASSRRNFGERKLSLSTFSNSVEIPNNLDNG